MEVKKMIFDIGMHEGQDSKHYLEEGYTVIAVEANPILAKANACKFKRYIDSGQLIIENKGIAEKPGILPFYINHTFSEWSSFNKEYGIRNGKYEMVEVACITTKDLIEKYGLPYYIKIDIEGNDCYVIDNLPGKEVPYVSCEFTDIELLDALKEKGYTQFKMISQGNYFKPITIEDHYRKWYPKFLKYRNGLLLRMQNFVSFKHPVSSSGPFGENTKGEWMNSEYIREVYQKFYKGKNGQPLHHYDWFDLHARS